MSNAMKCEEIQMNSCKEAVTNVNRLREERNHLHDTFLKACTNVWKFARDGSVVTNTNSSRIKNEHTTAIEQMRKDTLSIRDKLEHKHWEMTSAFQKLKKKLRGEGMQVSSLCLCYCTYWIPDASIQLNSLKVFDDSRVSIGAGATKSFQAATSDYMKANFPSGAVYRVPAVPIVQDCFKFHKKKKSKRVQQQFLRFSTDEEIRGMEDESPMETREILSQRKSCMVVEELLCGIYEWAKSTYKNAFIFSNYDYQNYLRNLQIESDVTKNVGDHDLFCIVEGVGVIFFQVKAVSSDVKKTITNKVNEAVIQVLKDMIVFQESNRDLHFVESLPLYCFVALPSTELLGTHSDVRLCHTHREMIMTKQDIKGKGVFVWLNERVHKYSSFCECDYQQLCGRYVGLASSVSIPTLSDGIDQTAQYLNFVFLTSQQKHTLDQDNRLQVIAGDYGTGKSLILVEKARQLAEQNPRCLVNIITCADIFTDGVVYGPNRARLLKAQLTNFVCAKQQFDNITVSTFSDKTDLLCMAYPKEITSDVFIAVIKELCDRSTSSDPVHILIEELTIILLTRDPDLLNKLASILPSESYIWVSIATSSYYLRYGLTSFYFENLQQKLPEFSWTNLTKIMRIPKRVINMVKYIEAYTGRRVYKESSCGHIVDGPKPLLYCFPDCLCKVTDTEDRLSCGCINDRMVATMKSIMQKIGPVPLNEITVVMYYYFEDAYVYPRLKNILEYALSQLNISYKWYGRWISGPTVVGIAGPYLSVVNEISYIGCENVVVIGIDPFALQHFYPQTENHTGSRETLPLTRCTGQYIHVIWNKEESKTIIHKEIMSAKSYIEKKFSLLNMHEIKVDKLACLERDGRIFGACANLLKSNGLVDVCEVVFPNKG